MLTVLIYAALPASIGLAAWAICHGNAEPNPAPHAQERQAAQEATDA